MELRPIPKGWTTAKGHYWEQGKPLLDRDVLELIEQSAALSSQLLEWATGLRAHTEEGPPQKRARREKDKEWWEEEEQDEDWEAVKQEDWASPESEEVEGHNPFVDWVEPELDELMAFLILAMKAILGYTALAWPTSRNLCRGHALERPKDRLLPVWR